MKQYLLWFLFISSVAIVRGQLLYTIQPKNGNSISYLYGTIHMMPEDQFQLTSSLLEAFESCSTLAMEVDLNMDFSAKIAMAQQTILPDGKTLKDITTPEQYTKIVRYCLDSCGMSKKKLKRYSRIKPFFFSSAMLQDQLKETKSYELEVQKMAEKRKKSTMGLESIQVQMETINAVSLEDQVSMLLDGINQPQQYEGMLQAYLAEDLDGLYQDIVSESEGFPNFIEDFLNRRNRNWIPVISSQVERGATFIAVGAGHLPGEQGVISLLRNAGYTITPVVQKK
jgi:uncharacterized protein YbaP (TraB family)